VRRAGFLEGKHESAMFALRDLRKDLDHALNAFHLVNAHVPMTALIRESIREAATEEPDLDISVRLICTVRKNRLRIMRRSASVSAASDAIFPRFSSRRSPARCKLQLLQDASVHSSRMRVELSIAPA
jgi:hypothetical protein